MTLKPAPAVTAAAVVLVLASGTGTLQRRNVPYPSPAHRLLDLASGRTVAVARPEVLRTAVAPGSIIKIATIMAALESRTIDATTTMSCPGGTTVQGRRIACVHPDLHRPLTAVDALAQSCNAFVSQLAQRLPRAAFLRALTTLGLRPPPSGTPLVSAALGLDGIRATPDELLSALVRLSTSESLPIADATRTVLERGLREAGLSGTASALGEAGFDALAKTGTGPMPGGGYEGLVVAVTPASRPARAVVAVVPGGSGRDASALAARLLALDATPAPRAAKSPPLLPSEVAVRTTGRSQAAIARMPLEDYVPAVVAAEAPLGARPAALEALAILARTYAIANRGRHRADGFDLCDLTHCQVLGSPTPETRRASRATMGQILTYRGAPALVFYTASCGGMSATASEVWPGGPAIPFLTTRQDGWCRDQPGWTSEIGADDLLRALRGVGFRGDSLRDLRVIDRGPSGRVTRLALDGLVPREVTGDEFRLAVGRMLGWQRLKSTLFDLSRLAGGYRFAGRGSGHGVGLCATGAGHMALVGQTARSILLEFFPGTLLTRLPLADIRVSLPAAEAGGRGPMIDEIERLMADLAERLQVALPPSLRVVAHPSVESYQRATGQPWWTAGATRGETIQLIPLASLRRRGILDRTLRHELVHVLTSRELAGKPVWVVEGLASYYSDEDRVKVPDDAGTKRAVSGRNPASASRPGCPGDAELQRAPNAAALGSAYRRARDCVAEALAAGTSWRQIR